MRARISTRSGHPSAARPAVRTLVLGTLALSTPMVIPACSTENVTEVVVVSVTIRPTNAALVEGGTMVFDAEVSDEGGSSIDGANVVWSSDNSDVVVVDGSGTARAVANGVATVTASFRDVTGSATLTVLPGPTLVLNPAGVSIFGDVRGDPPGSSTVRVTNAGMGALGGVRATASYENGSAADWLTFDMSGVATPSDLTLTADTEDLAAGIYDASILVTTDEAGVDAVSLPVRLTLAGFTFVESGGGTTVEEDGGTDRFTVVLDLEPARDIVLSVTSEEPDHVTVSPARLTFTEDDWDDPKRVTVRGVDNDVVDGDRVVRVRLSVDQDPDSAYAVVEDRVVEVEVRDDDVADFLVRETGAGTVAREGGPSDTITVELTAGPQSNVVFSVRTDDETDAVVEPTTLTFTPLNWNVPQIVIFTAVDDTIPDGIGFRTITVAVEDEVSDEAFHGLSRTIDAITFDNDFFRLRQPDPGG